MGRLIPAGTGGDIYRVVECESDEPLVVEPAPAPAEAEDGIPAGRRGRRRVRRGKQERN